MKIDVKNENGTVTVSVEGWINVDTVDEFEKVTASVGDYTSYVLDLEKVELISSAGLRQIVSLYKSATQKSASFAVINVAPNVMEVFNLTGINKKIDVKPIA